MASTQNNFTGTDSSFRANKSKNLESGIDLSSKRKDSLEKKAIDDKRNQEQAKAKEISRREKESKERMSEESDSERNTNIRRKEVIVGRPDTAKDHMDPRSKLAKQAQIKTKIIDEVRSMSLQKFHNLPDSLVSAVASVLEGKNPFAKKDDAKDKDDDKDMKAVKKDDDKDDDKDTKSSKKSDDGDDADKKIGKDGKKTKVDMNPKTDDSMKEEAEQIDEISNKTLRSYSVGASRHLMDVKPAWIKPTDYQHGAAVGAHGKTAQKRAQGLEKASAKIKQNIAKANATASEEVSLSDDETARILAKLNERSDDDEHQDGPEHIVMQLRKAKSLGADNRPIHFHDGSKVKVSSAHVQKALDMHGSFKKAPDKDEFTKKLQASHASFKSALGEK